MVLADALCNTTWWFFETSYYIRNNKGSCWCDMEKTKRQESSGTSLDMLAKGAFVKIGSMVRDVWIHSCSHGFLDSGYGFEGFHGCIAMVFFLNNAW
jgi:hypothetical protein